MAIKNQAKRKAAEVSKVGKRFSKSNERRKMVTENVSMEAKKNVKVPIVTPAPCHTCTAESKYEFTGNPVSVFSATLTENTVQCKGYDVLSKGQQVTVELFGILQNRYEARVRAMDGRVGVIKSVVKIKPLCFA